KGTRASANEMFRISPMRLLPLFIALSVAASAQQADTAGLNARVKAKIGSFPGKVTLYAKNLDTGATYGIAPEQPVRTASTIKLAIMVECFAEAAEGKLKWTEPLRLIEEDKVS